jgi:rhamnosyltransferase
VLSITMLKKYRIAALITAYENVDAVLRCISSLHQQSYSIEKILIVDNSKFTPVPHSLNHNNIIVNYNPENIGVSGSLSIGIKWAVEQKYDFLWTFDQDSQPNINCLELLLDAHEKLAQQDQDVGIVAPLPIDSFTNYKLHGLRFDRYKFIPLGVSFQEMYDCDAVITSGSLINLKTAYYVELPNTQLFIDAVDWEYCLNLRKHKLKVYLVPSAILNHQYAQSINVKLPFINQILLIHNYSPLRRYYICRNHTYVEMKFSTSPYLFRLFLHRINYLLKTSLKIIFYESDQKNLKLWACFIGTIDGFLGRLDRRW